MLHCSKSAVHLYPCALHLYYSITSAPSLVWAREGMWALSCVSGSRTLSDKQDKSSSADTGHLCQSTGLSQCLLSKIRFWGTCPSVRPVNVWQHSQKLSEDGGQTAWLYVKSLRKETELASCPGHALVSVFSPLLLVFLMMPVWFVSLSSLELASQLVPHSVIIIFHLYVQHSCTWNNEEAMHKILRVCQTFFPEKVSLLMGLLGYTRHF